jgi:hypothetical protein
MNTPESPLSAIPSLLVSGHGGGGLLTGGENADQPVNGGQETGGVIRQWRGLKLLLDDLEITPDEVRQLANVRSEMAKWSSIEGDTGTPEITDLGGTGRILVVIGHKDGGSRAEFERLFNLECNMASMVVVNGMVYKDNWRGRRKSDGIKYQAEKARVETIAAARMRPLTPESVEAIRRRAERYLQLLQTDETPVENLSSTGLLLMVDIPRLLARLEVLEGRQ